MSHTVQQQGAFQSSRVQWPLGGLLVLPALGLVLGPLVTFAYLRTALHRMQDSARQVDGRQLAFYAGGLAVMLLLMQFFAAYEFFRRKTFAPAAMIMLLLANVMVAMVLANDPRRTSGTHLSPNVLGAITAAAIWVPYFLISPRVKRTFVL